MNILCSSSSVHMVQAGITIGNRLGINSGYRNNEKAEIIASKECKAYYCIK